MASQREYEKRLWGHLLGHLNAMDWQEVCGAVDVPDPDTQPEGDAVRLSKAKARVDDIVWRKAQRGES